MSRCPNAKPTDEYHGYECKITGGACNFLFPNLELCQAMFGDEETEEEDNEHISQRR